MDLSEQDLKKIKSLHVMLKMPIWILERETNRVLKSYKSIISIRFHMNLKKKIFQMRLYSFTAGC